jgi:hypothetical protein
LTPRIFCVALLLSVAVPILGETCFLTHTFESHSSRHPGTASVYSQDTSSTSLTLGQRIQTAEGSNSSLTEQSSPTTHRLHTTPLRQPRDPKQKSQESAPFARMTSFTSSLSHRQSFPPTSTYSSFRDQEARMSSH